MPGVSNFLGKSAGMSACEIVQCSGEFSEGGGWRAMSGKRAGREYPGVEAG